MFQNFERAKGILVCLFGLGWVLGAGCEDLYPGFWDMAMGLVS